MRQLYKVFHIEFNTPYNGKKHHYFGSKTAIFEHIPEHDLGITLKELWDIDLNKDSYSNEFVTIRLGWLKRKKTKRGRNY